jgi:5-methylcytosine-specific restriction protein A
MPHARATDSRSPAPLSKGPGTGTRKHPPKQERESDATLQNMPTAPKPRCTAHGCPEFAQDRGKCTTHATQHRKQRRTRETWAQYGTAWQAIRKQVLTDEPDCRSCGNPATQVDHIKPLRIGGTNDRQNLQPLCHSCHSRKTQRENT